jgi:hypothetical protein
MGEFEKEWNVRAGVRPDMKLTTYLRRKGFSSIAKTFDMLS